MRRGLSILSLALLTALSAMAIVAVSAQAEGAFKIEGKVLGAGEEAELEGTGGSGKLLVPGLGLTITCPKVLLTLTVHNQDGHAHLKHHELRHECFVEGNKFCKIYPTAADRTAKTNAGLLLSLSLSLEELLDSTHHDEEETPQPGSSSFGKVYFSTAKEGCTLPSETEITGSFAVKIGAAKTEQVEHGVEDITEVEEKALGVSLLFGKEPAVLDEGNGSVHLIGKFLNKKFSLD